MLAGPAPGARLLEIRFALRYRDMGRLFIAAHSAPGASRLIRRLAARTDVYVGVCLRTRRAGGRDAIDRSHLAFVEIDTPDALDRLRAFRHPPSAIVLSGSAGHAHAYYTLSAPVTVPELERANRRLAHALGGDLASVDAARILRPPSSWNHKHTPPDARRTDRTRPGATVRPRPARRRTRRPARPAIRQRRRPRAEPAAPNSTGCCSPSQPPNTCTRSPASPPTAPAKSTARFTKTTPPRLQLYEDGTWYCYGACKAGGSIFDFAARPLWTRHQRTRLPQTPRAARRRTVAAQDRFPFET